MELPNKVLIGYEVIDQLGSFIRSFGFQQKVLLVCGEYTIAHLKNRVEEFLHDHSLKPLWVRADASTLDYVKKVEELAVKEKIEVIVGLGGGKSIDVAKLSSFNVGIPYISAPTSASHDGISSPFASIRGLNKVYSFKARPPIGIIADVGLINEAPKRLFLSGCGDLVAKLTAVSDWRLARDEKGEYYGDYAASLALLGSEVVLSRSKELLKAGKKGVRSVVEALISAGVAAGIAGSSRPCSGSEHLFSHALEMLAPGKGLHGEKCGLGAIMMAKLHGMDWKRIRQALMDIGAPVTAKELGLSPELVVDAIIMAPSIRPERYTILHKLRLDRSEALELAKSTNVI